MRVFPFTAIVGQERMRRALILNAISPQIGGVLIRGERGTAKSTAARALAALLPDIEVVADCPFHCDPRRTTQLCDTCRARADAEEDLPVARRRTRFVDLPVSATEDRVVGTLDIERAIKLGERHFEPGVLALANRGLLYVDEVNLLDDHVVDRDVEVGEARVVFLDELLVALAAGRHSGRRAMEHEVLGDQLIHGREVALGPRLGETVT